MAAVFLVVAIVVDNDVEIVFLRVRLLNGCRALVVHGGHVLLFENDMIERELPTLSFNQSEKTKRLRVREHPLRGVYVENLTTVHVTSYSEIGQVRFATVQKCA